MESQSVDESLVFLGNLFENYRRIKGDKIKRGYPIELKNKVILFFKKGVDKKTLLLVTKISSPTLKTWIFQCMESNTELASPKELKITIAPSDSEIEEFLSEKIAESYCAKINLKNGTIIELNEKGLLLSLNTLCSAI